MDKAAGDAYVSLLRNLLWNDFKKLQMAHCVKYNEHIFLEKVKNVNDSLMLSSI